jgi:hypothetical protein
LAHYYLYGARNGNVVRGDVVANVSISEEDLFKFVQLMHSEEPLLYFIQSGDSGPIKIGVSKNIASRLNQLQTGHPEKLTVIGICKGGYFEEKRLHSVFAAFRRKGEWFTPHKKILEYVWDNSLIRSESVSVQLRDVKGGRPKQKRDDSNPIAEEISVDHSVFKNLSPLAQATAIVLERRGMVRIVRDEEEEGSTPPRCSNDESKALLKAESAPNRSEPLSLSNDEYRALDPLRQAIALVGAKKGLVVFTDVDNPFIEYLNEGDA